MTGAPEAAALNAFETAFFIGAELSAIVLLAATAVVALRTGVLPRWWAAVTIVLAVWLVIGPIGWLGLLAGLPVWTVVTSLMLMHPSAVEGAAGSVIGVRRMKPLRDQKPRGKRGWGEVKSPVTASISALAALFAPLRSVDGGRRPALDLPGERL